MSRIALVASSYLPQLGGVEEHVFHLAEELRGAGHEVFVWSADRGDRIEDREPGVRYLPTPLPRRSPVGLVQWALRSPVAAWLWWRALRVDRPEVIDIHCFGSNGPWALALSRLSRVPLVYSNHGETFMDAHGVFDQSALLRTSLRRTLARAAAVTSCSAFAAADLARFGEDRRVHVTGNGVDPSATDTAPVPGLPDRYIAAVGRHVAVKGFDRLIEAYADARARGTALDGVDLVIGGDGPERARLERLARERGMGSRVHFTGALSRPQVRSLMANALLLVVPSLVEAFGIVVLEGWRAGTTVVATNRGGVPEFLTDEVDGVLFDPADTAALAGQLVALVEDPERRARLGAAGRSAAAEHSWAAVADAYGEVFAEALDDRAHVGDGSGS